MNSIKFIWANQQKTNDIIIKTRISEIDCVDCYAGTNRITGQYLFIVNLSPDVNIPSLNNYKFKSVQIYSLFNETESRNELYIYLLDTDLLDIFSLFIQNIIEDFQKCNTESEALNTALNLISKWKKLFDIIAFNGLSSEEQKGLIGELLYLNDLLNNKKLKTSAINYWTSTENEFQSKDFIIGQVGIEIKLSTSKHPFIKISNEKQLDSENLNKLFLILYSAEAVKENGFSLNSLVEGIRNKLATQDDRDSFNTKLKLYGYNDQDKLHYQSMYLLRKTYCFEVTEKFPRITRNFMPAGTFEISYNIEKSAIDKFIVEPDQILENI